MRLNPLPLFTNPSTRPRAIVWTGVALMAFLIVWAAGLDGTSTYWFCTAPCHIVHDDNTLAYQQSTHTNVACVACHEPVNTNPLHLTLLKIEVAPDAITTIRKTFELPMNDRDYVALEMRSEQCTQCHNMPNRTFTPQSGLLIDHAVHAKNNIQCTMCHNRVAHPEEDIKLVLAGDKKHENWMTMDGCFRCHSRVKKDAKTPPGTCTACHTDDFKLTPPSHDKKSWYTLYGDSSAHSKAAKEESATIAEALKLAAEPEGTSADVDENTSVLSVKSSSEVNSCYTCHAPSFCADCHKVEIPHSAAFRKDHAQQGFSDPSVCGRCHARSAEEAKGTGFCNACHHPKSAPGTPWLTEHPAVVKASGAEGCLTCHKEEQCAYCHVNGATKFRALENEWWK
ncbi:MAG: hypothetical protein CVT67_04460 [Actinobacteria bacterium HGW-Actinobacteria-7]|jgi:hypothetical protein|nr:MAG: hypothetical protein CVT67_04460 [Actinobacteria bacterium HGW-Actinobacteria-7]